MKLIIRMSLVFVLLFTVLPELPAIARARNAPPVPNPVLIMVGSEYYMTGAKAYVRYNYQVFNAGDYSDTMFAAAPALPPCGANTKASRTWVDIFDQTGKRLYGFCALGKSSDLNGIWFALPADELPPSWIYIEMTDRQTNTKYKSNLAETVM